MKGFQFSLLALLMTASCAPGRSEFLDPNAGDSSSDRYLYVASGACYAGGVTTSAGSQTVAKYNLQSGEWQSLAYYVPLSLTDTIVDMDDYNSEYLLVTVETAATTRRLDLVHKVTGAISSFLNNATAFATVLRSTALLADGGLLVADLVSVEKFDAAKTRLTNGGNAYINNPATNGSAVCANSNTAMTDMVETPSGAIVYAHAAATPNNKIGLISPAGYSVVADCRSTAVAPITTALPTSMTLHSSGDLLVAYASTTAGSNFIYPYSINSAGTVITDLGSNAYINALVVDGPSRITEDRQDGYVYVASARNTLNTIERFTYSSTTKALTRVGSNPFVPSSVFTRCVAGMVVGP
jgi:hypothetical protein